MTTFELLTNKKLNGVCDYSAQTLDYINKRVSIYKNEKLVTENITQALKSEVIDFFVEDNNRIVIYI